MGVVVSLLPVPNPRTWSVYEQVTSAALNTDLRDAVNFLISPPLFRGSITAATAVTVGANVAFPVVEDNYAGWNTSGHYWTAPVSGLLQVQVQFKWNSSAPAAWPNIEVTVNGSARVYGPSGPTSAPAQYGGVALVSTVRVNVGDKVAVVVGTVGFTTQVDGGADNNFLNIFWVSS